ncbi:MAG: hypothetical protein ACE5D6_01855 [Candidatus Zixiibacteriota bacterium]
MKKICSNMKLVLVLSFTLIYGCDSESNRNSQDDLAVGDTSTVQVEMTVRDTIENVLNEAMTRLHYGDKSGLYENEFIYYKNMATFDEYLKTGQMAYAEAESLTFVEIVDLTLFDHDSAEANVTVHFKGASGKEHHLYDQMVTVYYHRSRWIKPSVSVIEQQVEYDNLIRQADSAAAAEAGEDF